MDGSKDIDYEELVTFLHALDRNDKRVLDATSDPQEDQERRWSQIVVFMRNNPKLLMQMIPDGEGLDDFGSAQLDNVIKRSRIHDKIQEA